MAEIHDYEHDVDGGDQRFGGEDPHDLVTEQAEAPKCARCGAPLPELIDGSYLAACYCARRAEQ